MQTEINGTIMQLLITVSYLSSDMTEYPSIGYNETPGIKIIEKGLYSIITYVYSVN